MAKLVASSKPLTVNPLNSSARAGAVLAFLGLAKCLPLEHGVRGCTAFTKLFFMRHFREPIPLQTSAVDEIATVVGADENIIEALHTVIERNHPELVGLSTTTLSDFQGTDVRRTLVEFRKRFPEMAKVGIVPVSDFNGVEGLEAGYACALHAIIDTLVPPAHSVGKKPKQVNILASPVLTPGDIDELKRWVQAFGLDPVVVPDLGDSLDGHLVDEGYQPLTYGGVSREQIEQLGSAAATIVCGSSLFAAGDLLLQRTQVPNFQLETLTGLKASDALTHALSTIAKRPVPETLRRQRAQLLDAMVDCQFYTAGTSAAIAGDPDLLVALHALLSENGVVPKVAVASVGAPCLSDLFIDTVTVGDLDDLKSALLHLDSPADVILANSHAHSVSTDLNCPLIRVGYPQHDLIGAHTKTWIGYEGTRRALFEVANVLAQHRKQNPPYPSIYSDTPDATNGCSPSLLERNFT